MPSSNIKIHKRVHARARRHYYRVMPEKKGHRIALWVVFLGYAGITAMQMLYPVDRALPLASIGSHSVAWQSGDQLAKRLNDDLQVNKLTLVSGNKQVSYPLRNAGADFNTGTMIQRATNYPFWWRFVPFSILWQPAGQPRPSVSYSKAVLKRFSNHRAKELTTNPTSARVAIEKGKLVAEDDISGQRVTSQEVYDSIVQSEMSFGASKVVIPYRSIRAPVSAAHFSQVKVQAQEALARSVTIDVAGTQFTPDQSLVASWLLVGADKRKQPVLKFDGKEFARYIDRLDKKVGKKPGMTNITLTNGIEVGRLPGKKGRAIDRSILTPVLRSWLLSGEGSGIVLTQLKDVAPNIIYNSKYTASEAGLKAYVKDKTRQMDVHIAVRQLSGKKWTASARADESIPSASTFKLYVAKWLFREMQNGSIHWDDAMLDTNVSTCFDRMTIASTNPCALQWIAQAGRPQLNAYLRGLGFSRGTSFTTGTATQTTANDLLKYMIGLHDGSLVKGAYRDRLLHSLSVHPYQEGVPSGSSGQVWNKVGFLWDYTHDAAIVKHPRGTYVIVVMTKGQSYGTIAGITREVERIMYP